MKGQIIKEKRLKGPKKFSKSKKNCPRKGNNYHLPLNGFHFYSKSSYTCKILVDKTNLIFPFENNFELQTIN